MLRKIFKTGNSTVISIPKETLEYLNWQEGTEVSVELDRENHRVVIQPIPSALSDAGVDEAFAREVNAFIEQYRPALEALAKK